MKPEQFLILETCLTTASPLCVKSLKDKTLIYQKTASIADAVRHYAPIGLFGIALEVYLHSVIQEKDNLAFSSLVLARSEIQALEEGFSAGREAVKQTLRQSTHDAGIHPEVPLSLVLWRTAYAGYFAKLKSAIHANPDLQQDEKENGLYVIENSLETFHRFIVFRTLMPLIFDSYRARTLQKQTTLLEQPVNEMTMNGSIQAGWKPFFERKAMRRVYTAKQIPARHEKDSGGAIQICPAHAHFRQVRDARLVEYIHQCVCNHRDQFQPHLDVFRSLAPTPYRLRLEQSQSKTIYLV